MIFFETAGQARSFLLLLCDGLLAGAAYDGIGLIRRRLPPALGAVLDVLWCAFAAAACLLALALGGERRVRLFALLGLCCGGGVYCLGLRALFRGLGRALGKLRPTGTSHNLPRPPQKKFLPPSP